MRKITAILLALSMVLLMTACGGSGDGDETSSDSQNAGASTLDNENQQPQGSTEGGESTTGDSTSQSSTQEQTSGTQSAAKGLNSKDISEIVNFYKAAAQKTGNISSRQTMTLARIDAIPANNTQKAALNLFEGIATTALEKNSSDRTDFPGNFKELSSSDVSSASASVSGNYTNITLNIKSQTDDHTTTRGDIGPVGHAVGTLGNISRALDELPVVNVDYSNGRIELRYDNCKVNVRIDNNTGKVVSGTWQYSVNIAVTDIQVSLGPFSGKLTNIGGTVDYKVAT